MTHAPRSVIARARKRAIPGRACARAVAAGPPGERPPDTNGADAQRLARSRPRRDPRRAEAVDGRRAREHRARIENADRIQTAARKPRLRRVAAECRENAAEMQPKYRRQRARRQADHTHLRSRARLRTGFPTRDRARLRAARHDDPPARGIRHRRPSASPIAKKWRPAPRQRVNCCLFSKLTLVAWCKPRNMERSADRR